MAETFFAIPFWQVGPSHTCQIDFHSGQTLIYQISFNYNSPSTHPTHTLMYGKLINVSARGKQIWTIIKSLLVEKTLRKENNYGMNRILGDIYNQKI